MSERFSLDSSSKQVIHLQCQVAFFSSGPARVGSLQLSSELADAARSRQSGRGRRSGCWPHSESYVASAPVLTSLRTE